MSHAAYDPARESSGDGRFVRQQSAFRDLVWERPEPGRFHLYVSLACPWASRAILVRRLQGLEDLLPMTVVDPIRDDRGWRFTQDEPDPLHGVAYLAELYERSRPGFSGRVTVPVLYDVREDRIVSNESADVIRMLNAWGDGPDLYPEDLREEIDALNQRIYADVNNGVYESGFARSQAAYDEAVARVFAALDWLEERLGERRYLTGDSITEADWRLFPTLVRFDAVYHNHFKCNLRKLAEYPNLDGYLRDLYQQPGIADTVDFDHIKRHYYMTHESLNPTRIVPRGPVQDLWRPHGRERLSAREATMAA